MVHIIQGVHVSMRSVSANGVTQVWKVFELGVLLLVL